MATELIKEYQRFQLQNQSSGLWKVKMNLCYTIKIKFDIRAMYFLWHSYWRGILFKSNGFTGTSVHIRCRKPGDVITLNGHRRKTETFIYRFENPHWNENNPYYWAIWWNVSICELGEPVIWVKHENDIMNTVDLYRKIDR